MSHFEPFSGLLGGVLIGASSGALWLLQGRVLGISGIVGNVLRGAGSGWQRAFVAGLLAGGLSLQQLYPKAFEAGGGGAGLTLGSVLLQACAGLLVGFGTQLSNGCTSGHGVTGLARMSPRSLVATLTFMGTGMATVLVSRHLVKGIPVSMSLAPISDLATQMEGVGPVLKAAGCSFAAVASACWASKHLGRWAELSTSFLLGGVFSLGLGLSGMTRPVKVLNFLDVAGDWDPTLACVMGGALTVNLMVHRLAARFSSQPLLADQLEEQVEKFPPCPTGITTDLVLGAALFGVGWGLAGICPGPAWVSLTKDYFSSGIIQAGVFCLSMSLGMIFKK